MGHYVELVRPDYYHRPVAASSSVRDFENPIERLLFAHKRRDLLRLCKEAIADYVREHGQSWLSTEGQAPIFAYDDRETALAHRGYLAHKKVTKKLSFGKRRERRGSDGAPLQRLGAARKRSHSGQRRTNEDDGSEGR